MPPSLPNMVTSGSKKNKMAMVKMQTQGFKTAVHKPVGGITDATSIIYTAFGRNKDFGASDLYGNLQCISYTDISSLSVKHRQTVSAESLNKTHPRHFIGRLLSKSPPYLMPFGQ